MNADQPRTIVVGFDGSPASQDAVRWAAAEAARRRLPLTLVHAGYYLYTPALSEQTARTAAHEIARYTDGVVEQALELVRELHPGLVVRTEIRPQQPAKILLSLAESAELVVLGSHGDGSLGGAILGSISQTVAAHAHCPVVVLNADRPKNAEPKNTVVVGVSPSPGGRQALRFAFEQARERGCAVEAVRSWGDVGWGAIAVNDNGRLIHDWQVTESRLLDECLAPVMTDYPEITVRRRLTGTRTQWALEEAAMGAELLVVGCHRGDDHWFSRLGPVASWLLHRSPCPIAVVGQSPVSEQAEDVADDAVREPAHEPMTDPVPLILW